MHTVGCSAPFWVTNGFVVRAGIPCGRRTARNAFLCSSLTPARAHTAAGFVLASSQACCVSTCASQRSLHNAPIFRLLLKVAVNGTHQCDLFNFCGTSCPNNSHLIGSAVVTRRLFSFYCKFTIFSTFIAAALRFNALVLLADLMHDLLTKRIIYIFLAFVAYSICWRFAGYQYISSARFVGPSFFGP